MPTICRFLTDIQGWPQEDRQHDPNSYSVGYEALQRSYRDIFLSSALLDPLEESLAGLAPMCSDCALEPYCGAEPVFHHATQGDFDGRKAQRARALSSRIEE